MAETGDTEMLFYRLCKAIENNDIENLIMYIEQQVNIQCYSERYRELISTLVLACSQCYSHGERMLELFKAGAQMLHYRLCEAIDNNDIEKVRMCIKLPVNLNRQCYSERYRERMYPLVLACSRGHEEIMEQLLKAGADPNQGSGPHLNKPVIHMAAKQRVLTLSMVRCLISHGADVNASEYFGQTVMDYLARGQFNDTDDNILSVAKLLLENSASFFAQHVYFGPLYEACKCGNIDIVKLFIDKGADVNANIGKKYLEGAAYSGNIDMVDLLLNAGIHRYVTSDVLSSSCKQNNHAMIAKIMDTCNVDMNWEIRLSDRCDMTILQYACSEGDITGETVRLLLDHGADVRAVTDTGDTALHYAAMSYDFNKVRQLLSYNPPLNVRNNENQTPLATRIQTFIEDYSWRPEEVQPYDELTHAFHILSSKIFVIAGAKVTADVEYNLNQFHIKHPEVEMPDYKSGCIESLKEMCRFVIRGTCL